MLLTSTMVLLWVVLWSSLRFGSIYQILVIFTLCLWTHGFLDICICFQFHTSDVFGLYAECSYCILHTGQRHPVRFAGLTFAERQFMYELWHETTFLPFFDFVNKGQPMFLFIMIDTVSVSALDSIGYLEVLYRHWRLIRQNRQIPGFTGCIL